MNGMEVKKKRSLQQEKQRNDIGTAYRRVDGKIERQINSAPEVYII